MSNHDLSSACWNKDDIQWCWYLHSCGECSYQRHSFPFFSSDSMFNCSFFQFSHSIVFSTLFKIRMQCAKSYSTGIFLMEVVAWKNLTAVNWCPANIKLMLVVIRYVIRQPGDVPVLTSEPNWIPLRHAITNSEWLKFEGHRDAWCLSKFKIL